MKNAGVGVGIPDTGRVKLVFEKDKKLHIYSGASCIGQGLGTVLTQMVVTNTDLKMKILFMSEAIPGSHRIPGTTSGSRQTLVTGKPAAEPAIRLWRTANAGKTIDDVIGKIYYGEYLAKTDPLGANVPNPVSHVAYGYATQMCILDKKTGKIEEMVAAHDVGKAVNPLSCEGQIEGRRSDVHRICTESIIRLMRIVNQLTSMDLLVCSALMRFRKSMPSLLTNRD